MQCKTGIHLIILIFLLNTGVGTGLETSHRGYRALRPAEFDLRHNEKSRIYLHGTWRLWRAPETDEPSVKALKQKPFAWWQDRVNAEGCDQIVPLDWHQVYPLTPALANDVKLFKKKRNALFCRAGMYALDFQVPADLGKRRAILHFEWVNSECQVFVNNTPAGSHRNFFARGRNLDTKYFEDFELDITRLLKPGSNTLHLLVFAGPRVKVWGTKHLDVGGIAGPVWIDIKPDTFARELYLAPNPAAACLRLRIVRNKTAKSGTTSTWTATVRPWRGQGRSYSTKLLLNWKKNTASARISMLGATLWDTENPFLYCLELRNRDNEVVGRERFGFRDFQAINGRFLLNGKRVWLRGILWHSRPENVNRTDLDYNKGEYVRTWLEVMKRYAQVNYIRIHNGGMAPVFFDICDELGLLVSDEFDIDSSSLDENDPRKQVDYIKRNHVVKLFDADMRLKPEAGARFRAMVRRDHNHPSVVMFNTGNERMPDKWFAAYANEFYRIVKTCDLQQRPVAGWGSGPHLEAAKDDFRIPGDYFDFHNYDETLAGGSWHDVKPGQLLEVKSARIKAHLGDMPIIDGETIGTMLRLQQLGFLYDMFAGGATDKDVFLAWVKNRGKWNRNLVWMHGLTLGRIGIHAFRSEDAFLGEHALALRYLLATERRELDFIQGIAMLGITRDFMWRTRGQASRALCDPVNVKPDRILPYIRQMGKAYAPLWICAYPFRHNLRPGEDIMVPGLVHNGTLRNSGQLTAMAELLTPDNQKIASAKITINDLTPDLRKRVAFTLTVPNQPPFPTKLLLTLVAAHKTICATDYRVTTIKPRTDPLPLPAGDIAILGPVADQAKSHVLSLLASSGIKTRYVGKVQDALAAKAMILAPGAMAEPIELAGRELRAWVEAGGHMLVLEQKYIGAIPFLTEYRMSQANPRPFVDVLVPAHPIFADVPPPAFRDWAGDGMLFTHWVTCGANDVDKTVLASSASAPSYKAMAYGMLATEVKLGKGAILFSQISACRFAGSDPAASRYLHNLLAYFTGSDFGKHALPPTGNRGMVQYYPSTKCVFLPVTQKANSGFSDRVAGDGKGGWADLGRANLNRLKGGVYRFHGINYRVVRPDKANHWKSVIVLGGSIRPALPKTVTDIPVNRRLAAMAFLHTSMYVKAVKGDRLGAYIIHYTDGTAETIPLRNKLNIADWWFKQDNPDALVAKVIVAPNSKRYALYVTVWKNPHPDRTVKSFDMVSSSKAILALIAATGIMP